MLCLLKPCITSYPREARKDTQTSCDPEKATQGIGINAPWFSVNSVLFSEVSSTYAQGEMESRWDCRIISGSGVPSGGHNSKILGVAQFGNIVFFLIYFFLNNLFSFSILSPLCPFLQPLPHELRVSWTSGTYRSGGCGCRTRPSEWWVTTLLRLIGCWEIGSWMCERAGKCTEGLQIAFLKKGQL